MFLNLNDKKSVISYIASFALIMLAGCKDENKNTQFPPPQVLVQEILPTDIPLEYEYPGRVAGIKEVEIHARVEGIILERKYTEGKAVKQGDILFQLDPKPFKILLNQAEAKLQDSKARLIQTKRDWQRAEELLKRQAITTQSRDSAVYNYKQSLAAVAQGEADVKTAKINLGYTTVTAPISGITSQETYSEGSLVGSNTADTILTSITQLDPVYVNFAYPDSDAMNQKQLLIKTNSSSDDSRLKVEIKLENNDLYPVQGHINFTDSIIDPITGTVNARAIFPNPDMKLMPGQFVRVFIRGLVKNNAIVIPEKAVIQGPNGIFVYAVDAESKATIKPVTLGASTSKGRIVNSGLTAHDKIIVEGMIKVRPNQPVQITKEEDQNPKNLNK